MISVHLQPERVVPGRRGTAALVPPNTSPGCLCTLTCAVVATARAASRLAVGAN